MERDLNRPEFLEAHFTIRQLAQAWKLSYETLRQWFTNEPGVIRIENKLRKNRRGYVSVRIPEHVARRVYRKRTGMAA